MATYLDADEGLFEIAEASFITPLGLWPFPSFFRLSSSIRLPIIVSKDKKRRKKIIDSTTTELLKKAAMLRYHGHVTRYRSTRATISPLVEEKSATPIV